MRLAARPGERIDRGEPLSFTVPRQDDAGVRRRHDRLGALRGGATGVLAQLQVPPAARAPLLRRALRELPDDGGRDPERPRLHDAAARRRGRQGAELRRLAAARPHAGDRQARRAVHPARLLLQDLHPPAQAVAALREVPPWRRRSRTTRSERIPAGARRRREPAQRRRRHRWRPGGSRGSDRSRAAWRVRRRDRRGPRRRRHVARRPRRDRHGSRAATPGASRQGWSFSRPRSRSGSSSRGWSLSPTATSC